MSKLTLVLPFYNQPGILRHQLDVVNSYPDEIKTIVIDDGSQVSPASEVFKKNDKASLYVIDIDTEWNLEGARNLGATVCDTDWMIMTDIDHIFPSETMRNLLSYPLDINKWYYFPRYRVGAADSTRNKDDMPRDQKHGNVKPHVNTYLITKAMYWSIGGNDEDYSGMIGGEAPFLAQLRKQYGSSTLLPDSMQCNVLTRDTVPDANITTLDRDTSRYAELRQYKGDVPATNPIRFTWHQVI